MDTDCRSNPCFGPQGCRCPPTTRMTVVCCNPYLTILATMVTIIATGMWICTHCRHLTWLCGYKYSRACTLYIFLYNSHFYVPLKIKHLTGHMHMYRIENPIAPEKLSFHRHCLWDSLCCKLGFHEIVCERDPSPTASEFDRAPQGQDQNPPYDDQGRVRLAVHDQTGG